jgi:dipeptidase E
MRMLLTSGGVSNDAIRDALRDLVGKPFAEARLVVVIDAILPFPGDKSKLLEHLAQTHALGWAEFDVLSLFAGPTALVESRLRSADVVLGYGGSDHWLMHAWSASRLTPVLRELLDEKVYVGWSAGSMIFSRAYPRSVEVFEQRPELELFHLTTVEPAVPLFDWFLMPHLHADFFPGHTDAWAAASAKEFGAPIWFIDDDTALLVRDPDAEPLAVSNGRWLRFDDAGRLIDSR